MEAFVGETKRVREEERNQALVDVSSILTWLTAKPAHDPAYLAEMVLKTFQAASASLPEDATIRKTLAFYEENLPKAEKMKPKSKRFVRMLHLYMFEELAASDNYGGIWETIAVKGADQGKLKEIWTIRRVMAWAENQKLQEEKEVPREIIEDYAHLVPRPFATPNPNKKEK